MHPDAIKAAPAAARNRRRARALSAELAVTKDALKRTEDEVRQLREALEEARERADRSRQEALSAEDRIRRLETRLTETELGARAREIELRRAELAARREAAMSGQIMRQNAAARLSDLADDAPGPDDVERLNDLQRAYGELALSPLFDADFYLETYPGVAEMGVDPVMHYLMRGADAGYDPSAEFCTETYLAAHPELREAGMNPLVHHLRGAGRVGPQGSSRTVLSEADIAAEAEAGRTFLTAYGLLGEAPALDEAIDALNRGADAAGLVRPDEEGEIDASIIIPVYGQLAYTLNCLDSLRSHASRARFEVIVYDDCSPDDITASTLERVDWIKLVRAGRNGGFIAACNAAAGHARGRVLVLLNNDTRAVRGWLDGLIDGLERLPDAGLVGSKLYYPDGSLQEAGGILWRDGSAWNYGRGQDADAPQFNHARIADYCSGASIAIPADLWRRLGGFDGETYERAYNEDSDLAFRIRDEGLKTWYQPASRALHYEGKTSGVDESAGEKAYQTLNRERFFERWRETLSAFRENADNPWREAMRHHRRIALIIAETTPSRGPEAARLTSLVERLVASGYAPIFAPAGDMEFRGAASQALQYRGAQCLYQPYIAALELFVKVKGDEIDLVIAFEPAAKPWAEAAREAVGEAAQITLTGEAAADEAALRSLED